MQALVDPGDEVVLVDPAWVSYEPLVSLAGGIVDRVDTVSHDFQLEPAMNDLTAAVDDDVTVISDEIYGKLTYDGGYTSCGTGSRL